MNILWVVWMTLCCIYPMSNWYRNAWEDALWCVVPTSLCRSMICYHTNPVPVRWSGEQTRYMGPWYDDCISIFVCLLQNEFLINAGDFGVIASVNGMSNVSPWFIVSLSYLVFWTTRQTRCCKKLCCTTCNLVSSTIWFSGRLSLQNLYPQNLVS